VLPIIIRCKELPQWIVSGDRAAYHPVSNTIYIRDDLGAATLFHEYCHWLFHKVGLRLGHRLLDWRGWTLRSRRPQTHNSGKMP